MSVVTLAELKAQLSWLDDLGDLDNELMQAKLDAAEDHIARMLGFAFTEGTMPAALRQAVLMLAAFWYENREAATDGARVTLPFGVEEIVREYRAWTF